MKIDLAQAIGQVSNQAQQAIAGHLPGPVEPEYAIGRHKAGCARLAP